METIDLLKRRLEQITQEFNILVAQNRQLQYENKALRDSNDKLKRSMEDYSMVITNRLKKDNS